MTFIPNSRFTPDAAKALINSVQTEKKVAIHEKVQSIIDIIDGLAVETITEAIKNGDWGDGDSKADEFAFTVTNAQGMGNKAVREAVRGHYKFLGWKNVTFKDEGDGVANVWAVVFSFP